MVAAQALGRSILVKWAGVVCLDRSVVRAGAVRVLSARTLAGGLRAIDCWVPFGLVARFFEGAERRLLVAAPETPYAYVFAELRGEHLQFLERASQREFFLHPERFAAPIAA